MTFNVDKLFCSAIIDYKISHFYAIYDLETYLVFLSMPHNDGKLLGKHKFKILKFYIFILNFPKLLLQILIVYIYFLLEGSHGAQ